MPDPRTRRSSRRSRISTCGDTDVYLGLVHHDDGVDGFHPPCRTRPAVPAGVRHRRGLRLRAPARGRAARRAGAASRLRGGARRRPRLSGAGSGPAPTVRAASSPRRHPQRRPRRGRRARPRRGARYTGAIQSTPLRDRGGEHCGVGHAAGQQVCVDAAAQRRGRGGDLAGDLVDHRVDDERGLGVARARRAAAPRRRRASRGRPAARLRGRACPRRRGGRGGR